MSQEILVPFALTPNGGIAVTTDPGTQTQQHVDSLVSTQPGERAMNPTYGVNVPGMIFGQSAIAVTQQLTQTVQKQMAKFEPGVSVIAVSPVNDEADPAVGGVALNVSYATSGVGGNSAPATTTAVILPGGTVIEVAN